MATSVIIVPNGRLYKGDIVLYGEFTELAKHYQLFARNSARCHRRNWFTLHYSYRFLQTLTLPIMPLRLGLIPPLVRATLVSVSKTDLSALQGKQETPPEY